MTEVGFQYRKGLIEMLNGFGLAAAVRVSVHDRPAESLFDRWKVSLFENNKKLLAHIVKTNENEK